MEGISLNVLEKSAECGGVEWFLEVGVELGVALNLGSDEAIVLGIVHELSGGEGFFHNDHDISSIGCFGYCPQALNNLLGVLRSV